MSIKSRVGKLEKEIGGPEPTVITFRTIYEGKDGEIESETSRSTIIWGNQRTASLHSAKDESHEAFCERLNEYAKLTWQQAQSVEGLTIRQGQGVELHREETP